MGHQLGLRVVAEGVERAQERDALIAMGCNEAQGYFYSPPVAPDKFLGLLEQAPG